MKREEVITGSDGFELRAVEKLMKWLNPRHFNLLTLQITVIKLYHIELTKPTIILFITYQLLLLILI